MSFLFLNVFKNSDKCALGTFENISNSDTLLKQNFFKEVKKIKNEMVAKKTFTNDQAVRLVKVYNTLHLPDLYGDVEHSKLINEFLTVLRSKYLKKILHQLHFGIGRNMSLYSSRYDLFMEPGTETRNKDRIQVI